MERDPRAGHRPTNGHRPRPGRFAAGGLVLAAVTAGLAVALLAGAPAAAQAGADQVTITGIDLAEPLEVLAEQQPELFAALHREVSFLVNRDGEADEPEPETLGPQYTLVLHVEGEPRHRFHLYPLAEGGPRAFRPVEQPGDRTAKEGWFYGRLSQPDTLARAGVPLTGDPPSAGGGTGGGGGPTPAESAEPDPSAFGFLAEWRQGMLLTGAAVVAIVIGLGGTAYLIRRKV
jgi:hypothetical protein